MHCADAHTPKRGAVSAWRQEPQSGASTTPIKLDLPGFAWLTLIAQPDSVPYNLRECAARQRIAKRRAPTADSRDCGVLVATRKDASEPGPEITEHHE